MNTTKEKLNKAYNSSKQHFNEHFKDPWSTHKKKISTVWLIGNAFLFPFFISATFACGALEQNNSGQAGFVLIWTCRYIISNITMIIWQDINPIDIINI